MREEPLKWDVGGASCGRSPMHFSDVNHYMPRPPVMCHLNLYAPTNLVLYNSLIIISFVKGRSSVQHKHVPF